MKPFYKTFLLLFLNVSLLGFDSFGQVAPGIEWQKCLGGSANDNAWSIQQTEDSGYIVAGSSSSNDGDVNGNHGNDDYWIVKIDSMGTIQWQKCYGGTNTERAYSVQGTTDGGYVVAGSSNSNDSNVSGNHGGGDFWIVKLDSIGNLLWQKCFGGTNDDGAHAIKQTIDGGFVVVGGTFSNDGDVFGNHSAGNEDYWIIKIDSAGNMVWQKCLGGTEAEYASSVQQTLDGGYIIGGDAFSNNGDVSGNHLGYGADSWIVKIDSIGDIQWQNCFGGTDFDRTFFIQQTQDTGYIFCGMTRSNNGDVIGHHFGWDYWIVKIDNGGYLQWQKCLGDSGIEGAYSSMQTQDGGYIIAGSTNSVQGQVSGNHGSSDSWIIKINDSGLLQWEKCFGGTIDEYTELISQTYDGGYIMVGGTNSNDGDVSGNHGNSDYWIVKLLPDTITSTFNIQHSAFNIQISPNPSSGIFQITFPSSTNQKTNYTLEVVNTLGQKVFTSPPAPLQRRGEFSTQLDVSFLPKGIYVLKINDDKNSFSRKLVIQ